jgi:N-acetylmuramoyl-L-alanine amidase
LSYKIAINTMKTKYLTIFLLLTILLTVSSFSTNSVPPKEKKFIIMIDAGHGGRDSGTPGTKRYKTAEKDIALDVTLALGKMLTSKMPQVEVIYTRTKDVYPTLIGRTNLANEKEVDLFISIHCNAQPGGTGSAYGSETFVLGLHKNATNLEVAKRENSVILLEENYEETYKGFDPNSPESMIGLILSQEEYLEQSIELADYIQTEFKVSAKRKSRGVKQAGFLVLAHTYMPSVLVELGFLTHKKEEDFLNSANGKKIMTNSLFSAVKKYVDLRVASTYEEIIAKEDPIALVTPIDIEDPNTPRIIEGVTFKVQIAASSRKISTKAYNFNGLQNITREKSGSIFKYYYSETSDFTQIKFRRQEAKDKGYTSSFLVAFKDGEKVSVADVLK